MIYELAIANADDAGEDNIKKSIENIKGAITETGGEVLIEDDWGRVRFAQATADKKETARFFVLVYSAPADTNFEVNRRLGISEVVLKHLIIKCPKLKAEDVVKTYRSPYSKKYSGSALDEMEEKGSDMAKSRRKFAKRRTCWFTAKKVRADWKDPQTFNWLINEFGKISAARVSGVSRKHQRFATTAIKRARAIGIASSISNYTAKSL
ncbi:MAG: 30S ribosomal protein S18 [Bacteriovoracaceae bacterium]